MGIRKYRDWHRQAIEHLRWSLTSSRGLATAVCERLNIERCRLSAFAPETADVAAFATGVGASVVEAVSELAAIICGFLDDESAIAVFEHHLLDANEPHGYLTPEVVTAQGAVYQVAVRGTPRAALTAVIRDWNVLPIYNVFLARFEGSTSRNVLQRSPGTLDVSAVASVAQTVIVGAYDGEGFLMCEL